MSKVPFSISNQVKSHSFTVPHNGADVTSERLERALDELSLSPPGVALPATTALNRGVLAAWTTTFIGEGNHFQALKAANLIPHCNVDAELSLQVLSYFKAVHPLYTNVPVPHIDDSRLFREEIQDLSDRALAAVTINDGANVQIMESSMENPNDGHSALLSVHGGDAASNAEAIAGIANLVENAAGQAGSDGTSSGTTRGGQTGATGQPRTSGVDNCRVGDQLLNTYEDNHVIYGGTFPFAFTLGVPEEYSGPFHLRVFSRLLLAYNGAFESCPKFIFLAFNQLQIRAASRGVAYEAKSNSKHLASLKDMLQSPDFDGLLASAVADPDGAAGKKVIRMIGPLIRKVGRKIPHGPLERANELSVLYAMQQRYGPHSDFITFSQSSSTQPLVIKWGSRMFGHDDHPGLLKEGSEIWNSDRINRNRTARTSPASCARYFDRVVRAVLKCLFGLASFGSRSEKFGDNVKPGIFGRATQARACHAVSEAQARGALHLHVLLWLVLGPLWYARFVHEDEKREAIARFLDTKIQVALSEELHNTRDAPRSYAYPFVVRHYEDAKRVGEGVAAFTNYHHHSPRCRKLPGGKDQCDLAKKSPSSDITTFHQVVLEDAESDDDGPPPGVIPQPSIDPPPSLTPPSDGSSPLPPPDTRVIPITMKRNEGPDQYMVERNNVLSGCVRCNTCNMPVGGACEAKAQVYYHCKYCTKNPVKLKEALPLLQTARSHAMKYTSEAADHDTPEGHAKYTLSKLLNTTSKLQEYSLEQASAALLGQPSTYKTGVITYVYIRPAMASLVPQDTGDNDDDDDDDASDDDGTEAQSLEALINNVLGGGSGDGDDGCFAAFGNELFAEPTGDVDLAMDGGGGTVHIQRSADGFSFVHQHDDYQYRPMTETSFLNLLEFIAMFKREPKPMPSGGGSRGRNANLCLEFQPEHPLYDTHYLQLRSLHYTPLLAGAPRPPLSQYKQRRTRSSFVRYYATLLIPWGVNYPGDWDARCFLEPSDFTELMTQWSSPDASAINRARYYTFYNIVHNLNAPYLSRLISAKWRFRAVDKWIDLPPSEVPGAYVGGAGSEGRGRFDSAAVAAADAAMAQLQQDADTAEGVTSPLQIRQQYIDAMESSFRSIYPAPEQADRAPPLVAGSFQGPVHHGVPFLEWANFGEDWAMDRASELKQPKPPPEITNNGGQEDGALATGVDGEAPVAHSRPTYEDLNDGQKEGFDSFVHGVIAGEQRFVLIHGGPGTGKTYAASAIVDHLQSAGSKCYAASFMWSAVFQLDVACSKSSIHAAVGLNMATTTSKYLTSGKTPGGIQLVRDRLEDVSVMLLDEISCTQATLFVGMDTVLKLAFPDRKDLPFAGLSVLCLGDFCQIPPPQSSSLAALLALFSSSRAAWAAAADSDSMVVLQAAKLFSQFKRVVLTEQMRAAEDPDHITLINRFSLTNTEAPLTAPYLDRIQRLSPALLHDDPAFEDAKIAVQSNEERRLFNRLKVLRFAVRKREPVFRWVLNMMVGTGSNGGARSEAWVAAGCREVEFLFVRGMPIVLTCSKSGHDSWEICNGSSGTAHSFAHHSSEEFTIPTDALLDSAAGRVFTIPQPLYVNVLIQGANGTAPEVIPLKCTASKKPFQDYLKHAPKQVVNSFSTALPSFQVHELDPFFSVTYNKLQGATVDRLILVLHDLSQQQLGDMNVHKLNVALTRVRLGRNLAMFPARPSELR